MKFTESEREKLILLNEAEYGRNSSYFNWITEEEGTVAQKERDALVKEIKDLGAQFEFLGSKADSRYLSKGCRICGEGGWSCLFINGMCNANCFYCPSRQDDAVIKPTTNTLEFESPQKYADYVNFFGFKGVSFSGGEPFITFDRTLKYMKELRKQCSPDIYIWLYTNGSLVNQEQLKMLKDEGLNEIRFDIGAFGYSLDKAEMAARHIETVTVEIPLAPDHFETVRDLVVPMKNAGIKHLNLHQLRVTPYNVNKMMDRDYKFVHGTKVTVFESEINVLKVMLHSLKNGGVPVNYCSFLFKSGFQSSAVRKRYAKLSVLDNEFITANGYIRNISQSGSSLTVTYFNPVVSGTDFCRIERKKIAVFNSENGFSHKDLHEMSNFEIIRGGFADYF
ncbi:MAG TPA: radical SAM protein [bacterium]|nr:radical SAM protein [bacterium]HQM85088.1 radical SAM protein [bacterium]